MLHIHRAERADGLIAALCALLADPLPDPLSGEVVAVPTRGMERWLAQRLSAVLGATPGRGDGVCANVDFPFPGRLIGDAVAAASGVVPADDPWRPERMVWPLLEVVDASLGEPWLHTLSAHLGAAGDGPADPVRHARRLSSVRHVADLLHRYASHRPETVRAWAAETLPGDDARDAPAHAWQAELWRRLRARIGHPGPAERLQAACTRLREDPELAELPPRLSLFGLTRLPAGQLDVLRALAAGRDVHLFLLHPSPALWETLARATSDAPRVVRRHEDRTQWLVSHRLLASWGQDARELQLVLEAGADHVDHHHPVEHHTDTVLARIQAGVREDRPPPGPPAAGGADERPVLDAGDRSLQVHACHGRARQVEVLRDAVLHHLQEDPTLEPRDVLVMCPDVETFAPLIHATFGAGEVLDGEEPDAPADAGARAPDLRVRLADRSLRQTNPLLGVVAQLIDLARARVTASEVLDLADREPVRRRFGLDDDDLSRMQDWVAESGVRWGLDAAHREPFALDALAAGTWRSGLDRILVGVTMTEDDQRRFGGVLPLDDVESGAIDLAGRLAELVDRLQEALDALGTPGPIETWAASIAAAADALTATSPRDAWQRSELQRLLDDLVTEATVDGTVNATSIAPTELRALLAERLQGRPTRANFRTGHLTVCTLVPMRSVPHRVVCLLGLDDGVFPRDSPRDGDDLMLDDPRVGERDARAEDRQMLLDALLAATDRLVVTYTGNDERTNAPRPPAVPVGELLDVVDATVRTEDGGAARDHVLVRHPLQPFDPRNFAAGELVGEAPWSFDAAALQGARALTGPRAEPAPFLAGPLAPGETGLVEVEDLVRFVAHPAKAFLRRRLGVSVGQRSDELHDTLTIELDGLGKWGVGQRLLDARLAGVDGREAILAEIARGTLPPGALGEPIVGEVFPIAEAIAAAAAGLPDDAAQHSLDVRVELDGGRTLRGTVPGVGGDVLRTVTYSRVGPKHRLAAWVRLLALTAAYPERPLSAATVGRAAGGDGVTVARIAALAPDAHGRRRAALGHLAVLVDLLDRGMRGPLPLACASSAAYARAAADGDDPIAAGRDCWESGYNYPREDVEPEHRLVLGGTRAFSALLHERPAPGETGPGWDATETTRFGRLARRLWDGLLACEELDAR